MRSVASNVPVAVSLLALVVLRRVLRLYWRKLSVNLSLSIKSIPWKHLYVLAIVTDFSWFRGSLVWS